ncbi:MAG: pilin [Patescibacteria group bacterium]
MTKTLALKTVVSNIFVFASIFFLFFFPFLVFADESAATENKGGLVYECDGKPGECDFDDLIAAIQKAVNWGTTLAISFSVVVIAYAGFKIMVYADSPGERTKAKEMLKKVAIGIAVILGAWLIVNLITSSLLKDELKDIF